MQINSISISGNKPSFGTVRLGVGGSERLAKSMSVKEAKSFISKNVINDCDILVTSDAVELIPANKNNIFEILKVSEQGSNYTDVEISDHGIKDIFRITPKLSEEDIDKYGVGNDKFSIAEAISNIINTRYDWKKYLQYNKTENNVEFSTQKFQQESREIEDFYKQYGMF